MWRPADVGRLLSHWKCISAFYGNCQWKDSFCLILCIYVSGSHDLGAAWGTEVVLSRVLPKASCGNSSWLTLLWKRAASVLTDTMIEFHWGRHLILHYKILCYCKMFCIFFMLHHLWLQFVVCIQYTCLMAKKAKYTEMAFFVSWG